MGDSGIYILSFFLSYLIIKNYNINVKINADLIFILMMLPGIDMLRLFIFRILNKKNPFSPDKNHIHHLLLEKFTYWQSIIIINFAIIIPILLSLINFSNLIIIFVFISIYLISIFILKNKFKKLL
jgi:UDP-GlcNAc:undecaprenyl-phosphate GlcNAc-1-phosphate transferase